MKIILVWFFDFSLSPLVSAEVSCVSSFLFFCETVGRVKSLDEDRFLFCKGKREAWNKFKILIVMVQMIIRLMRKKRSCRNFPLFEFSRAAKKKWENCSHEEMQALNHATYSSHFVISLGEVKLSWNFSMAQIRSSRRDVRRIFCLNTKNIPSGSEITVFT